MRSGRKSLDPGLERSLPPSTPAHGHRPLARVILPRVAGDHGSPVSRERQLSLASITPSTIRPSHLGRIRLPRLWGRRVLFSGQPSVAQPQAHPSCLPSRAIFRREHLVPRTQCRQRRHCTEDTNATKWLLSCSYASRQGLEVRIETAHTPGHRVAVMEKAYCQVGEGRGIGDPL